MSNIKANERRNNNGQPSTPQSASGNAETDLLAGLGITLGPITVKPTATRGIRAANPMDKEVVARLERSYQAALKGEYEGWPFGGTSAAYRAFISTSGTLHKWTEQHNAQAKKDGDNGVFVKVNRVKHEQSPNTYDPSKGNDSDMVVYIYGVETFTPAEWADMEQAKKDRAAEREAASVTA